MKILFMIPTLSVGGAEKVLVNLVNSMDKKKFDITVMALFDGGVNRQFLNPQIKYVSCFRHQFRGNSHLFKMFSPSRLFSNFVKEQYDIIVSYLEGPTARIVSGCPFSECRLVSWIHCTMHNKRDFATCFRSYEEAKMCYRKYDECIFVSKEVRDHFLEFCTLENRNDVIYNTNQSNNIIKLSREDVEESYFKNHKGINLCAVGKIIPVKGFDRLARIHAKLRDEGYEVQTFILGVGPQQVEIERFIKQAGCADSFHFLGYQTNPYKYIRKCDLFVCSSRSEGFSTAVTEALIIGIPVITTRVSGMHELLGDNEFGLITENNESALFNGIKILLDDTVVLEDYAKRSIKRGLDFKTENTVKMVEKMLSDVMEKK